MAGKSEKIYKNIPVHGSPERSAFRIVLEDDNNNFLCWNKFYRNLWKTKNAYPRSFIFSKEKFSPYTAF